MKKAQGLSMNVIIMAVIAIIVLVILVFVFRDRIAMMQKNIDQTCVEQGGECAAATSGKAKYTCDNDKIKTIAKGCKKTGLIAPIGEEMKHSGPCCLPIPKQK